MDVLLTDGRVARIREFRATDREAVLRIHDTASDASIYNRFLNVSRLSAHRYVDHLCGAEPGKTMALVAELDGQVVALATTESMGPRTAEMSVFVADGLDGKGVATLLLEHLAAAARLRGCSSLVGEVRATNHAMVRVLEDAGFDITTTVESDLLHFEMSTAATDRAVEAADARECAAEARSLEALRRPRCVAVAGVRRDGTGVGRAVLDSIREGGFAGHVVVVHPAESVVGGVRAYPTLAAVPQPVDLLLAAVPASGMLDLVEDAGAAGVRCTVILTADFAETGDAGRERQHAIVRSARAHGMRLIGPNCFGVGRYSPTVRLDATFARSAPLSGGLAVATQSGGVSIALQDVARRAGLGLAAFVSLGNKCDVSGNDMLAAWLDDDEVTAAALYLESFGNPRKFARLARRFSEHKPLLAIVGGRSASGSRAGASHTAAAASPAAAVDAVFNQAGVVPVQNIEELVQTAQFLSAGRIPTGRRLGILGNAGGLGVLGADAAFADGLEVPLLSAALQNTLAGAAATLPGSSNPVDLGAAAGPASFADAATALLRSGEIDSLLVVFAATRVGDAPGVVAAVRDVAHRTDLPVALVLHGADLPPGPPTSRTVPVLGSVESAVRAIAHAARYGAWRATSRTSAPPADTDARNTARQLAAAELVDDQHGGWLTPTAARALLATHGVSAPIGTVAADPDAAVVAARQIGYPVAVKVADPNVLHKTDRRLVTVGITSDDELIEVLRGFARILGTPDAGPVLVQPVIKGGVELAIGMVRDSTFGPVVMVAAGGIATDVWKDRAFVVPPVSTLDVARAIQGLRIAPLLQGWRGAPASDIEAVEALVLGVVRLAEDVPELAELDLNPVVATPDGAVCVDVRMRLEAVADNPVSAVARHLDPA